MLSFKRRVEHPWVGTSRQAGRGLAAGTWRRSIKLMIVARMQAARTACAAGEGAVVAVIGAGPAGLVTAKSLLELGLRPVVFDQSTGVGGLWNPDASRCWGSLRTNLSRFTCSFSDHPWPDDAPTYVTQADMHQYLKSYADSFLSDTCMWQLGCRVVEVRQASLGGWRVSWSVDNSYVDTESDVFDYVVLATGVFTDPFIPDIAGLSTYGGRVLHSRDYRQPDEFRGQQVVVIGGSFSGVELAAEIAMFAERVVHVVPKPPWVVPRYMPLKPDDAGSAFVPLDLAFYRRSTRQDASPREQTVHSKEAFAKAHEYFGKFCSEQASASSALPCPSPQDPPRVAVSDTYQVAVRSGRVTVVHGHVVAATPTSLQLDNGQFIGQPAAIRQDYAQATGREAPGTANWGNDPGAVQALQPSALVLCTGYRPALPHGLDIAVLDAVKFDARDSLIPLALHCATWAPGLPHFACVGLYRGPYFGVMELQARWVAAVYSGAVAPPSPEDVEQGQARELQLRGLKPRPQFPHPDYVGMADYIAKHAFGLDASVALKSLQGLDAMTRVASDVVLPAQFRAGACCRQAYAALADYLAACERGHNVARAVFRALHGDWKFTRSLVSSKAGALSGVVHGRASFVALRAQHSAVVEAVAVVGDHEWLYSEQGSFETDCGQTFRVRKQYAYTYDASSDRVDVHFADMGSRGGFFHSLQFLAPGGGRRGGVQSEGEPVTPADESATTSQAAISLHGNSSNCAYQSCPDASKVAAADGCLSAGSSPDPDSLQLGSRVPGWEGPGWRAAGTHLCSSDMYYAFYRFAFKGVDLREFVIGFVVQGPNKDYVSSTKYTR